MNTGPLLNRIGLPGDESAWAALGFDITDGTFRLGAVTCTVGAEPAWGFDRVHADPAVLGIPVAERIPGLDPSPVSARDGRPSAGAGSESVGASGLGAQAGAPHPEPGTRNGSGAAADSRDSPAGIGGRYGPGAGPSSSTASLGNGIDSRATHPNVASYVDHLVYWVPDLDDAVTALNAVLGAEPRRRFHPRGPSGPEMAFYRVGKPFLEVVSSGRPPILAGIAFGTTDLDRTVTAVRAAGGPIGDPKPAVQGGRIASVWNGHVKWGIAFMEPKPR
ncbi:VOC family protein [Nocardia aurantia]|uniref:VOC domain-containing protein n=1 Tax=Nocardia aurantia TaxID=2585199 RepID=A0A7K0DKP4_9NOCA|nr:VOC family protein [Nocardia aurantia]MQY26355.1 hypothetical protein [Nocardia aurantia]